VTPSTTRLSTAVCALCGGHTGSGVCTLHSVGT
jgi:hypothetical protein